MQWWDKLRQTLEPEEMRLFDLLGAPTVARGEDGEQYCRFVTAIIRSVSPDDVGDLLYLRDLIDLEWDVLRYRSAKAAFINDQSSKLWTMTLIVMIMMTRPGPRVRSPGTLPSCDSLI
jgi:hypothetical protein